MAKTSVYLTEELAERVKASGLSLSELIRRGLDSGEPDPPVTRSELRKELSPIRDALATISGTAPQDHG